jgi:hypothetical protein
MISPPPPSRNPLEKIDLMSKSNRYSVILGNLGNTCDRFLPTGYKDKIPKEAMVKQAAEIPGTRELSWLGLGM